MKALYQEDSYLKECEAEGRNTSELLNEAEKLVFDIAEHEGLILGGSSGVNVAGAIRLARKLGPGHSIVTVLCDYGTRYTSKLFNADFLRSKDLPVPAWVEKLQG